MKRRAVVAIVGVAAVSLSIWALVADPERPYRDMVAHLKAAGEPVDFDGIAPKRCPDSENGAADLRAANAWWDANLTDDERDGPDQPWNAPTPEEWIEKTPRERKEEAAALIDRLGPFLDHVRAATKKPRIQLFDGPRDETGFPADDDIRSIQHVAHVLTGVSLGARDQARRLDAIAFQCALADRFEGAFEFDDLIAAAVASSAIGAARREIEGGRADPDAFRDRLDPLLRKSWLARAYHLLRAHRAFVIQGHRAFRESGWPHPRPWYDRLWTQLRPWRSARPVSPLPGFDVDGMLDGMARALEDVHGVVAHCDVVTRIISLPRSDFTAYRRAVAATVGAATNGNADLKTLCRQIDRLAESDGRQRLARVALAAAAFRAKHGDFPASLDDLKAMFADGVPLDPFTDAPFVYAKTPTGVRIASAGRLAEDAPLDEATLRERCLVWELKR